MLGILRRVFSFADWTRHHPTEPPPGDMLDASFDAQNRKISEIEALVSNLRRSDGQLRNGLVGADQLSPDLREILRIPTARSDNGDQFGWKTAEATADVWAHASKDWAEHMPDTIPENSVAVMDITGDHWSSRWWAHQAATSVNSRTGGAITSDTAPVDPPEGQLWWNSTNGNLYAWYIDADSAQWVQINTDHSSGDIGDDTLVTATDGTEARTLSDWFEGMGRASNPYAGDPPTPAPIWSDQASYGLPAGDAIVQRFSGRTFIAEAAKLHPVRASNYGENTWLPTGASGPGYLMRDAHLVSMSDRGAIAITGMSRGSDGTGITSPPASIGVAGFVLADATGRSHWAAYFENQHEVNTFSSGIEIATKNKSASDTAATPYVHTTGAFGLWLAGGASNAVGGASTFPSDTAIYIVKNGNSWNRGIIFGADAISGTDGVTGQGIAISFAKGHEIRWYENTGNLGAAIRCDVSATASRSSLVFADGAVQFFGSNSGKRTAQITATASNVNFPNLISSIAAAPVQIGAAGDDTNIDLQLTPKGTGNVRFGSLTASGDVAVTGYITIKDAGGTTRKLAVIA